MENQDNKQVVKEEVKVHKTLNTKQYRAFLIYCDSLQKGTLKQLEEASDKLDLALRRNSSNRQVSKEIRFNQKQVKHDTYETKKKINNIAICIDALNQFESLNKVSYTLTEEFITEESKRYNATKDDVVNDTQDS